MAELRDGGAGRKAGRVLAYVTVSTGWLMPPNEPIPATAIVGPHLSAVDQKATDGVR
jgi:hypothetical protein